MKQAVLADLLHDGEVAPLAGAWIETPYMRSRSSGAVVAPLAGAWIETLPGDSGIQGVGRRPPRGGVD